MPPETATAETKPKPGFPHKGRADRSWPVCTNCGGFGAITQERAILIAQAAPATWPGPGGLKGDDCLRCNGVGRVPDPSWPRCGCPGDDADCEVCHGLGQISPETQALIDPVIQALSAELSILNARRAQYQAARRALTSTPAPPVARKTT